jgi:hypothetical protein
MRERFHQTLPWLVLALLLSATRWGWQDARSDNERVRRRLAGVGRPSVTT